VRSACALARTAILFAAALTAGRAQAGGVDPVVARAGEFQVTLSEVRAQLAALPPQEQASISKDPGLLSQLVRTGLARRALLAEARGSGFDRDPGVKAQLDRVRDQALTDLYVDELSRPPAAFPTEAELQAAYDANRAAFAVPTQYRLAQIFVAAPARGDAEAEKAARRKLDDLAQALSKRGADFAAVARGATEEKSAAERGGELGWVAEDQLVPGIRQVVTRLPKGGVSEAIQLDDGWHVLKLLDQRPAGVRSLAEVRDALAARLRAERARASRQAWVARLLEKNPPSVNELALSELLARPGGEPRAARAP
jgi:peptidylprolyl isomerase